MAFENAVKHLLDIPQTLVTRRGVRSVAVREDRESRTCCTKAASAWC